MNVRPARTGEVNRRRSCRRHPNRRRGQNGTWGLHLAGDSLKADMGSSLAGIATRPFRFFRPNAARKTTPALAPPIPARPPDSGRPPLLSWHSKYHWGELAKGQPGGQGPPPPLRRQSGEGPIQRGRRPHRLPAPPQRNGAAPKPPHPKSDSRGPQRLRTGSSRALARPTSCAPPTRRRGSKEPGGLQADARSVPVRRGLQRLRDAVLHRTGLARETRAALDRGPSRRNLARPTPATVKGLAQDHLQQGACEVDVEASRPLTREPCNRSGLESRRGQPRPALAGGIGQAQRVADGLRGRFGARPGGRDRRRRGAGPKLAQGKVTVLGH